MKGNVFILSSRKIDGRYNKGKIVGQRCHHPFLSSRTFESYKRELVCSEYQVAYQDVFTKKLMLEWFNEKELSKEETIDAKH